MPIEITSAIITAISTIIGATIIPIVGVLYFKRKEKLKNRHIENFRNKLEEVKCCMEKLITGVKTEDIQVIATKSEELRQLYRDLSKNDCQEYKNSLIFWFDFWHSLADFLNTYNRFVDSRQRGERNSQDTAERVHQLSNEALKNIRALADL